MRAAVIVAHARTALVKSHRSSFDLHRPDDLAGRDAAGLFEAG